MAETYVPRGIYMKGYTADEIAALPAIIGRSEVARIARVSERTVTREASRGNIAGAFKVGTVWRFNTARVCEQYGALLSA